MIIYIPMVANNYVVYDWLLNNNSYIRWVNDLNTVDIIPDTVGLEFKRYFDL